jgi:hypothetical protein
LAHGHHIHAGRHAEEATVAHVKTHDDERS